MQTLSISHRLSPSTYRLFPSPVTAIPCRTPSSLPSLRALRCCSLQSPSLDETKFFEASRKGNVIPLRKCILSDHLTPILAYRCLVKEDDQEIPSFLFESVESGVHASTVGRYSVVGAQPAMEIVAKENNVTILDHEKGSMTKKVVDDPMAIPRSISESWKPQFIDELPSTFCGGWVGYFSYDTVRYVEKKKLPFLMAPQDDRNLADIHLGLYEGVIVFDHVEKKAHVIHWVRLDQYSSIDKAYVDGMRRLEMLASRVLDIDPPRLSPGVVDLHTHHFGPCLKNSNMTSEEYKNAVLQAKEYIFAGDIFHIVLSQRFERRTFADPFEVYRALRAVNPSPYMTYLQARGCILVASSPEILTRLKKNKIVNRPLAGTSRRGRTLLEDEILEKQMLNDEKQCAEHIVLVDLGRNDVGKVSKYGSVNVERLMNVERYSHVMHISSTVTGELRDNLTCWDALSAAMPVGTVSGAPKFTSGPWKLRAGPVHVAYRQVFATIVLAPFAYFLERTTRPRMTLPIFFRMFLCSIFGITMNQVLYLVGLHNSTPTIACALTNLLPALTFILAVPFGLERMGIKRKAGQAKIFGTVVCVGGAMLLSLYHGRTVIGGSNFHWKYAEKIGKKNSTNHANNFILGPILVIASTVSWAIWFSIQAKMSEKYPAPYTTSTLVCLMATVQCVIIGFCADHNVSAWVVLSSITQAKML